MLHSHTNSFAPPYGRQVRSCGASPCWFSNDSNGFYADDSCALLEAHTLLQQALMIDLQQKQLQTPAAVDAPLALLAKCATADSGVSFSSQIEAQDYVLPNHVDYVCQINLQRESILDSPCSVNCFYNLPRHHASHDALLRQYTSFVDCTANHLLHAGSRIKETHRTFTQHALSLLRDWYDRHQSNPYVTALEAQELADQAGVSTRQIRKWLSNQRTRSKMRSRDEAARSGDFSHCGC